MTTSARFARLAWVLSIATAGVGAVACENETLPAPNDPASATRSEQTQCGKDSDCGDQQRCVAGSCTSAR